MRLIPPTPEQVKEAMVQLHYVVEDSTSESIEFADTLAEVAGKLWEISDAEYDDEELSDKLDVLVDGTLEVYFHWRAQTEDHKRRCLVCLGKLVLP